MSSQKLLLLDHNFGKEAPLLLETKRLYSYLHERGHQVQLMEFKPSSSLSQIYELTLAALKQIDLLILIVNDENLLLGLIINQSLQKNRKCLLFTQSTLLQKILRSVTARNFYLYKYQNIGYINNILSLFKL